MILKGKIWIFGDDIDTDQIYPGKYLPITDKKEMARHAMEGADGGGEFLEYVQTGDMVVAGKNFGCGSSREHAPVALRGAGISAVIARSFARIFRRNAVNTGLPILELDDIEHLGKGDIIEVDTHTGSIRDSKGKVIGHARTVSDLEMAIMEAGGLLRYLKRE
jgi:3-isopropylmalate/(R)-2-methylmalate dehydratase small subunit